MSARLAISLWTILPLAALTSPVVAQRHKTVFLGAGVARPTDAFASEVDPLAAEFPGRSVRPFFVLGTGMYYFKATDPDFTDNKFGVNVGAGARWRRLSVEGRYHSVFDRGDTYWALMMGLQL